MKNIKTIIIEEKTIKKLKRIIKTHKNKTNIKIELLHNNKLYNKPNIKLKKYKHYLSTIEAFNIKDKYRRIEYIYEYLLDYIDNDMKKNNYCKFIGNQCIANRKGYSTHNCNGCCYILKQGLCKYLTEKGCQNPNISCKLYMCKYLEKNKRRKNYDTKKIYLTSCFFSNKEHNFFKRQFFLPKEEILKKYLNI